MILTAVLLKFSETKYRGKNPKFLPNSGSWPSVYIFHIMNCHLFLCLHSQFDGKFRDVMSRAACQEDHLKQKSHYLLTVTNGYLLNPNNIQDTLFEAKGGSLSNEEQPKQLY